MCLLSVSDLKTIDEERVILKIDYAVMSEPE